MSKRKLLINEVFRKAKEESQRDTKNGLASYLWLYFKEDIGFEITDKSFSRYYDTYVIGNGDINIQRDRLDKLSEYIGYTDFVEFSNTFVKTDEEANKTTVKISVDKDENSFKEIFSNLIINITNEQHSKIPDFVRQNGMGFMEMVLLICLLTGNVVFSHHKNIQEKTVSFMSGVDALHKNYMYWNGERYLATDSSYISPEYEVVAMNVRPFLYLKRITRKDTMTVENSLGKTWYSKYNGEVEFFTSDGIDPDNKKELKKSTALMIEKYAGAQQETLPIEE